MKRLFEYAILYHEYTEEGNVKTFKETHLVQGIKSILATTEKEVVFKATREVDEKYASDPDNVQILVRNF